MKHLKHKLLFSTTSLSLSLLATAGTAFAGFQYNPSDLLIGLRITPNSIGSSSYELVIDAGPVTTYSTLPTGQSLTVTNLSSMLLNGTFAGGLADISWSAFADVYTNSLSGGSSNYPLNTIWVTKPRFDNNNQSVPWNTESTYGLANTVSRIEGLAGHAVQYGNAHSTGTYNTSTGVRVPAGDVLYSYSAYIGTSGNFKNAFGGDVEQFTSDTFPTDGVNVRSDFYLLIPNSNGTPAPYLGYFEFSTNGVLTYTSGPSATTVPTPQIITITSSAGVTAITFGPTVSGTTYTLHGSNSLLTPKGSWPAIGSPATGTTASSMTINDTTSTSAQMFYYITAP